MPVSEGEIVHLTHTTAVIQWTVPTIAFSAEIYTFMYSVTEDTVNTIMIGPFSSGTDISQTNKMYSIALEDLSPGTRYYYQIKAENTIGMTLSEIFTFDTRKLENSIYMFLRVYSFLQHMWEHLKTLLSQWRAQKHLHSAGICL